MTKFLARTIDVYSGREKGRYFWNCAPECVQEVASLLKQAEAYDFGHLPLEPCADRPTHFTIPRLSDDEMEFFVHDVLPFPAETLWLQFTLGDTSALLVDARPGPSCAFPGQSYRFRVQRFDAAGLVEMPGIWGEWHASSPRITALTSSDSRIVYGLKNSPAALEIFDDVCHMTLFMVMMLYSKTTNIEMRIPSKVSNRIRGNSHRAPLPAHRVVTIVPGRYIEHGRKKGEGGAQTRRIHWRRSHLRHYDHATPLSRYAPNMEHKGKVGWHVVAIPRFLVGSKDVGEVMTHEYRVKI